MPSSGFLYSDFHTSPTHTEENVQGGALDRHQGTLLFGYRVKKRKGKEAWNRLSSTCYYMVRSCFESFDFVQTPNFVSGSATKWFFACKSIFRFSFGCFICFVRCFMLVYCALILRKLYAFLELDFGKDRSFRYNISAF